MAFDAAFWATVALAAFIGLVLYLRMPKTIANMLDSRIKKIEDDLDEAKRLREEAQALLANYERKRKAAESEAEDIVSAAQEEAKRLSEEASKSLEEYIVRRTRAVEEKIAQAEVQALDEVRARSADVAIEAARILLTKQMSEKGDALVTQSIKDVAAKLN
jgi:F-type H+-transporting ATPase subunit b